MWLPMWGSQGLAGSTPFWATVTDKSRTYSTQSVPRTRLGRRLFGSDYNRQNSNQCVGLDSRQRTLAFLIFTPGAIVSRVSAGSGTQFMS